MKKQDNNNNKQNYYPVCDANDPYKVSLEPIPEHTYHRILPNIWKASKLSEVDPTHYKVLIADVEGLSNV